MAPFGIGRRNKLVKSQEYSNSTRSDPQEIVRATNILFESDTVVELRIPKTQFAGTVSGYYSDLSSLQKDATSWSGKAAGVYWTLNPVRTDLIARSKNRFKKHAQHTTADADILARRWLLIDLDPKRSAGISSTDTEHLAAIERGYQVRDFLKSKGWPDPILADSGNGAHLLYRIDLQNDPVALALISNILKALDVRFSNSVVGIDTSTSNAARICKVYGTLSAKGDNTEDRAHRLSKILEVPVSMQIVESTMLVSLAAEVQQQKDKPKTELENRSKSFDLHAFLTEYNIEIHSEKQKAEGQFIELKHCVWNKEHIGGSAWIAILNSGSIVAGCHHNSCHGKNWNDFRTALGFECFEFLSIDKICLRYIENLNNANLEATLREIKEAVPKLDSIARGLLRESLIAKLESLGIRAPAKLSEATLKIRQEDNQPTFIKVTPWPETVDGAELLDEIAANYRKYLSLPPHAANIHALWDMHTWCISSFFTTPILNIESPIMRSGKSRTYEIKQCLVKRAATASNITAAVIYRLIDAHSPTLLLDELDSYIDEKTEALRGILNSGNNRSTAHVWRCDGNENIPCRFSTFAARSVAHIKGKLPDTLRDRSITITMQRRKPGEQIAKLRSDKLQSELMPLAQKLARWADDNSEVLRDSDPDVPPKLDDRAADCWRPLLAIADLVGGSWPKDARDAAIALAEQPDEATDAKIQLLSDFRTYFDENDIDRVWTRDFIEYLKTLEHRRWAVWKNDKPISANAIAFLLKGFNIHPREVRIGLENTKGYLKEDFEDAFMRNLGNSDFLLRQGRQYNESNNLDDISKPRQSTNVADAESVLNDWKLIDVADVAAKNSNSPKCKHNIAVHACSVCWRSYLDFDGLGVS